MRYATGAALALFIGVFLMGQEEPLQRKDGGGMFDMTELGRMTQADGWGLNSQAKWVSALNRIPADDDFDGRDNFTLLTLSEMNHEGAIYRVLTKSYASSSYQYPKVKMGLKTDHFNYYWIFEPEELSKLSHLPEGAAVLIEIPAKNIFWLPGEGRDLSDWLRKNPKDFSRPMQASLLILAKVSKEKNLARFMVYGKEFNAAEGVWYYVGNKLSYDLKTDPLGAFGKNYFECAYQTFRLLFGMPAEEVPPAEEAPPAETPPTETGIVQSP